jgi:hypothetical protein
MHCIFTLTPAEPPSSRAAVVGADPAVVVVSGLAVIVVLLSGPVVVVPLVEDWQES